MNIYAVWDAKAEAYLQPFFTKTHGLAVRMFQQAANDQEHQFNQYAEDYTLFCIGVWEENTGVLHAQNKEPLGSALQYLDRDPGPDPENLNPPVTWPNGQQELPAPDSGDSP